MLSRARAWPERAHVRGGLRIRIAAITGLVSYSHPRAAGPMLPPRPEAGAGLRWVMVGVAICVLGIGMGIVGVGPVGLRVCELLLLRVLAARVVSLRGLLGGGFGGGYCRWRACKRHVTGEGRCWMNGGQVVAHVWRHGGGWVRVIGSHGMVLVWAILVGGLRIHWRGLRRNHGGGMRRVPLLECRLQILGLACLLLRQLTRRHEATQRPGVVGRVVAAAVGRFDIISTARGEPPPGLRCRRRRIHGHLGGELVFGSVT
mmetsp:Transcript_464/g.1608  ORF Transcript_464/g.1608 Transcript_464/m.1608 type:complete len:259 (+) Transcript_464:3117-3893(+)